MVNMSRLAILTLRQEPHLNGGVRTLALRASDLCELATVCILEKGQRGPSITVDLQIQKQSLQGIATYDDGNTKIT